MIKNKVYLRFFFFHKPWQNVKLIKNGNIFEQIFILNLSMGPEKANIT
jgi:hypothetical protein